MPFTDRITYLFRMIQIVRTHREIDRESLFKQMKKEFRDFYEQLYYDTENDAVNDCLICRITNEDGKTIISI